MSEETNSNVKEIRELYSMFHQEYIIMAEYRMLQTENLEGIYVIPSYENSFQWFGVVFVRAGFYEGGVFRFTLTLPDKFPNEEVPVLAFTSHLYHPAVDANTGILNLSQVFPQWDRKRNHIWHILKYLHLIFHNLNMKTPTNVEASVAYKTNRKIFTEKVKECVVASIDHVYDEPPTEDKHYITFKPYDSKIHDSARHQMLKPSTPDEGMNQGMSWVQPGSYQPFSKEETT
ncbi:AKT-interacting protein [Leguminivora glycinivorella]|uniref:AKT-interacting protein n=1 Tax=Leguminivora glycinivorella TaxID=1035111 RepID=UPI00200FDB70|nr:AKT-interacting protein [Leguminivora glycinivorella]